MYIINTYINYVLWTLDRIDNIQMAMLLCNLQRKRKSKDSFTFTKQFVLVRDEY